MSHREAKIIAAVPCPVCLAHVGQACRLPQQGRLIVHAARKLAWQQWRATQPVDYVLTHYVEGPEQARTLKAMLVAPQSARALDHLRSVASDATIVPRWTWIGGALCVPQSEMPALAKRLIAAGWRLAEEERQP